MPITDREARGSLSQTLAAVANDIADPSKPIPFEVAPNLASVLYQVSAGDPNSDRELKVLIIGAVSDNAERIEELLEGVRPLLK